MKRWFFVVSGALPLLVGGCQDDVQCERERLDLNKAWSELRTAATQHKLQGTDVSTWTEIENRAELLESAFVTRQVTWSSADKASKEIQSKLPALESSGDVRLASFRASAESAIKQQSGFEKSCR
ncbi:MAG: hypothetical protein ABW061_14360 [Polyangiaceae bacterium]